MTASIDFMQFDLPLPAALARLGASTGVALCGPSEAPVIIVLGGISADRFPGPRPGGKAGWWPGVASVGGALDPGRFRLLGIDFVADPAGRVAPSTADVAALVAAALDRIGVARAHAAVGASYGGMIAMRFAQDFPDRCERLVAICADAHPHPAATAIRELQRRVVALGLAHDCGTEALAIARGMAMLTYRTSAEFGARFAGGIDGDDVLHCSAPGAYLRARGEAYADVMSAERFLSLSASIDRHRADPEAIALPTLLIGTASDQLVPPSQLEALAARLAGPVRLHLLPSRYGHDMFLKDAAAVSALIAPFLELPA